MTCFICNWDLGTASQKNSCNDCEQPHVNADKARIVLLVDLRNLLL